MPSKSTEPVWNKVIFFSERLKERLRIPLGELRYGDLRLDEEFAKAKPLVVVGDYTFGRFLSLGVKPDVVIVDMKVERREVGMPNIEGYVVRHVVNPAGSITPEAAAAVVETVKAGRGAVLVEGEEDLLALPALSALPDSGLLVYGQPRKGYVVVRGGERIWRLVKKIVEEATS
ncbi:MAG: DUF359 domain-containing protein [Candidatus Caldarchaeum sp.]